MTVLRDLHPGNRHRPDRSGQAEILPIQARLLGRAGTPSGQDLHADSSEPPQVAATSVRADELLGYLAAADEALYAPAAGAAATRLLVRALRISSTALAQCIETLPSTEVGAGQTIKVLLAAHLAVEGTVLLPALAELPGADLSALRSDLQTLLGGGRLEHAAVIDVTEMPHGQRHPRIFARYARLAPGQGFTLVNNHDPKPLRREFEATYPGAFTLGLSRVRPRTLAGAHRADGHRCLTGPLRAARTADRPTSARRARFRTSCATSGL